ncbi:hypothetical protein VNO80_00711 [Phaseolus coccineus]|uniref:Disease resistance protein At4g27190-like leucine-rich repeats domain-containing protein n=1 Tax=Phaseolus coccineus TaxID=3886 RepID=A0AAN9NZ14_PHACN
MKLTFSQLPNLENVWNGDPHRILSMRHLQEVHVEKCKGLTSLFPASIAIDIVELKNLVVENCKGLITIVAEDNIDPSLELTFPCPGVRSLKLQGLSKLKYFYYSSLKSDIYTHLESHTVEQLECLSLGENGVKMILLGEFQRNLLDNLKALTLYFSSDEFEYEFLKQVPNTVKLVVCDGSFKKMFCCESPNNVDYSGLLLKLKVLHLESLKNLVSIGLQDSWAFVKNLETFEVISCSSVENLVSCSRVSFSNLICLKVKDCDSLSYLFTSQTAKSLAKLQRMEIKWCKSIEEIVFKKEGEESDENGIIFSQLNCLNLDSLRSLRSFYKGSLNFPSLEELSIKGCDEMVTLCAGNVETGKLSQVEINDEVISLETDLNFILIKEFLKKAASWKGSLELRDRADLQEIWSVSFQIRHLCFRCLKTLIVEGCHFSSYVLPFTLLPSLPKLETLEVRNCDSVKTIFDVQCPQNTVTVPLKTLVLWKLPNLESVWNEDPSEIVTEVNPADPKETNPKLTFPTLTSLTLWDLPKFKHNTIHSIHHATTKLITPKLEHLTVGENELKMIVVGEFQRNLLEMLKALTLYFDIECDEFPDYGFLQQLPNVNKFVVCSSSFKVIFCFQRLVNSEHLLQLKELRLESLGELVSIGLQNSLTEPFVKNLETFEVISCSSLENLVSCRVSFSNLICLKVENCDNLSYLFTSSTAKSLAQLQRMKIRECKSIEEIVSKEVGEEPDEDDIIFPKLSHLNLYKLLKLRRFYRGSLNFPLLEKLLVTYCKEMETLCGGTVKRDKLSQVRINNMIIPLETDLNSIVKKQFEKKVCV